MAEEINKLETKDEVKELVKDEQVVETEVDDKPLFDPQSFIEGLAAGDIEKKEGSEEEEEKPVVEEKVVPQPTVNDSNLPPAEYTEEEKFIHRIAADLGVDSGTYEEVLNNINHKQIVVQENETVKRIDGLSNMSDDELVSAWLTTRPDYTEEEVRERIELWRSSGELKHQAKDIRSQLDERRKSHIEDETNKKMSEEAKRKEIAEGFSKGLNETVSKTSSLYDGAYNFAEGEKESLVTYIVSGQFQKDILSEPYRLIEAAHFVKNRDLAIKIIRQQGVSDGTQKTLNNIRPIDSRAGGYMPDDGRKGVFDARKFMSGFDGN